MKPNKRLYYRSKTDDIGYIRKQQFIDFQQPTLENYFQNLHFYFAKKNGFNVYSIHEQIFNEQIFKRFKIKKKTPSQIQMNMMDQLMIEQNSFIDMLQFMKKLNSNSNFKFPVLQEFSNNSLKPIQHKISSKQFFNIQKESGYSQFYLRTNKSIQSKKQRDINTQSTKNRYKENTLKTQTSKTQLLLKKNKFKILQIAKSLKLIFKNSRHEPKEAKLFMKKFKKKQSQQKSKFFRTVTSSSFVQVPQKEQIFKSHMMVKRMSSINIIQKLNQLKIQRDNLNQNWILEIQTFVITFLIITMGCDDNCGIENGSTTTLVLAIILPTIIGIFLIIQSTYIFPFFGEKKGLKYYRAYMIITISILLMVWFGIMSWGVFQYKCPCNSANYWFNGSGGITIGTVIVGMFSNIIFGFIDNAGLFFGGVYLEELFEKLPGGLDANVTAGYGNTFSDFLGSFLGTFCGLIISHVTEIDSGPIWAESVGITIGCLLGILIPKMILRNSKQLGLNRISTKEVLLGAMDNEELRAMLEGKSLFDFRSEQSFHLNRYQQKPFVIKTRNQSIRQRIHRWIGG